MGQVTTGESSATLRPLASVRTWPDDLAERYRDAGLWNDETFVDFIVDRTQRHASRTAVVGVDVSGTARRWSYADLAAAAAGVQAHLTSIGVRRGDRVVIALPNVVEHLAVVLGVLRMGALPVFGLPSHRERELAQFCRVADAAALVLSGAESDSDHVALHEEVSRRVRDEGGTPPVLVQLTELDPALSNPSPAVAGHGADEIVAAAHGTHARQVAFLQLSGGTTGVSKLIPRAAADYLYSVRASAEICGLDETSRMLVVLPMAHNFAMSSPGVLGILHVGGAVVLARDPSPRTAFALIAAERVTTAALVPPLAQAWVAAARRRRPDLSSLTTVQVGGARLAPAVAEEIEPVLGARLQQVFGMAEGLVNYTRDDDPMSVVTTTQGRPISAWDEIRVVDETGVEVPAGEEGELLTRGPYTIRGYYADPVADASHFTEDGFYRTGDLVRQLPTGHLQVTGRAKDQINRGGEKIACVEIEEPLLLHPEVHDVVALGLPDPFVGEQVTAVVVPTDTARLDELRATLPARLAAHLRTHGLASWKVPERFVLVEAFPATHVGKNSRRDLRTQLVDSLVRETAQPVPPPRTDPETTHLPHPPESR